MSMSTHVYGVKPPDGKWQKMKDIYDACNLGEIEIPDEVMKFFNYEDPCPKGVKIDLSDFTKEINDESDMENIFEIDIEKLPKDIRYIRVVNSY